MKKLFALAMAVAAMSAALAMPTLLGTSGGFLVQDASITTGVSLGITAQLSGSGDDDAEIPPIHLQFGVRPDLEIGALYMDADDGPTWGVFAKYLLPFTLARATFAVGATYSDGDSYGQEWNGVLSGTWPAFGGSEFTAAIDFNSIEGDSETMYLFSLTKAFENKTKIGLEYYFNMQDLLLNDYLCLTGDFGTVYVELPINEMLTSRLVLTSIANQEDENEIFASLNAKF
ncbi:MAG: hypothetical protein ACYC7E_18825 [Armatimonadota bacterium]